jgi:DNA-binding XRE family transcriptional regulator
MNGIHLNSSKTFRSAIILREIEELLFPRTSAVAEQKRLDEEEYFRIIGNRIKFFRCSRMLTQKALGDRVGVRFQQIQKYETGANKPSIHMLNNIAYVLEVPLQQLLP